MIIHLGLNCFLFCTCPVDKLPVKVSPPSWNQLVHTLYWYQIIEKCTCDKLASFLVVCQNFYLMRASGQYGFFEACTWLNAHNTLFTEPWLFFLILKINFKLSIVIAFCKRVPQILSELVYSFRLTRLTLTWFCVSKCYQIVWRKKISIQFLPGQDM